MAKNRKKPRKRIPKTIAGVKVPKDLRKAGGMVLDFAESPLAREIVAASFMAAIGAVATSRKAAAAADEAGEAAAKTGRKANVAKAALKAGGEEMGRRLLAAAKHRL